jgi:hypothetical protein
MQESFDWHSVAVSPVAALDRQIFLPVPGLAFPVDQARFPAGGKRQESGIIRTSAKKTALGGHTAHTTGP